MSFEFSHRRMDSGAVLQSLFDGSALAPANSRHKYEEIRDRLRTTTLVVLRECAGSRGS